MTKKRSRCDVLHDEEKSPANNMANEESSKEKPIFVAVEAY